MSSKRPRIGKGDAYAPVVASIYIPVSFLDIDNDTDGIMFGKLLRRVK